MKKSLTIFLQIVIVILGLGVLVLLLWEPHLEGRNVGATLFEIYFKDPFLAVVYVASIAFFTALWQGFKLLGSIGRGELFKESSVKAVRTIKYCALTLIVFAIAGEVYILTVVRSVEEDVAGGVAMGLMIICICTIVATVTAVCEKLLQNVVSIKSENDLTV